MSRGGESLGWRGLILDHFRPDAHPLTVVDDPDGTLLEEGVQAQLDARGYTLLNLADVDPVVFRLSYETRHRPWDADSDPRPLIVRTPIGQPEAAPYDLLARGRRLRLGLDEVFPSLHYGTLKALPTGVFDTLALAAPDARSTQLGERETVALVLRHVYDADPGSVHQPEELLRVLLRLHYRGLQIPEPLADRFVETVRQNGPFRAWPLDRIVGSREAFLAFIQERWPLFVAAKLGGGPATGKTGEHRDGDFALPGPAFLPLDHEDVRVYVDNLFLEGYLEPIDPPGLIADPGWLAAGLHLDPRPGPCPANRPPPPSARRAAPHSRRPPHGLDSVRPSVGGARRPPHGGTRRVRFRAGTPPLSRSAWTSDLPSGFVPGTTRFARSRRSPRRCSTTYRLHSRTAASLQDRMRASPSFSSMGSRSRSGPRSPPSSVASSAGPTV